MFALKSKWTIGAVAGVLVLGSVSALAGPEAGNWREKMGGQLAKRAVAKAGLEGEAAQRFLKAFEETAKERRERRQEMRQGMKDVVAAQKAGQKGPELKKAIDRLHAAFLAMVDGNAKTMAKLRETLSPAQQTKLLLTRPGLKMLALPGMRQAAPAMIGHFRAESLAAVEGLDPAAGKKLEEIGAKVTEERAKIVEQGLEIVGKLRAAGPEGKESAALLQQLIDKTAALRETVSEQLTEVRKSVPDTELAKIIVSLHEKRKSMREKLRSVGEAASEAATEE